ncbi:MAG: response regulator [Methylococcaceae bacterium]|nr:response regulator [Methylococcaceae bacterium]
MDTEKILVVDDDLFAREFLAEILAEDNYVVETVGSGKLALTKCREDKQIKIIVLDMNMPEMNGLELIKELNSADFKIPVIILTGSEDISMAVEAISNGASDYLLKGENVQETILHSVRKIVEKEKMKAENLSLMEDLRQNNSKLADLNQKLKEEQDQLEAKVEQRTAALLAAKNIAEKANQAKTEFMSSMSHELRTPMNAVLGFAQILEYEDLTEDQHDSVNEILVAGKHLLELINKVLDLSKIESGHLDVNKHPVSLTAIIKECMLLIRPMAKKYQIKTTDEITPYEDIELHTDKFLLKQVVINLLSNAIKYNKKDGSVTLSFEKLVGRIRIKITDTGRGLTEEQCAKIFQPFERLDAKNSTIEGSGVGLSICKQLVGAMGGLIAIESTPGVGSCFYLELSLTA